MICSGSCSIRRKLVNSGRMNEMKVAILISLYGELR